MYKILVNCLQLNKQLTGIQYHIKKLCEALSNRDRDDICIDFLVPKNIILKNLDISPENCKFVVVNNKFERVFFEQFLLHKFLKKNQYNLYHSPTNTLPYFSNFPSVVTIHDLLTFDNPELCQKDTAIFFRKILPSSIKKAQKIIVVSNEVKERLKERFNVPENKVTVIHNGVDANFWKKNNRQKLEGIKQKYLLPEKFILFVGAIEPKKNLTRLVKAIYILKVKHKIEQKLVVVGKKGWKYNLVFEKIKELKLEQEVCFTGYVSEEDLPSIYSLSDVFAFPSIYEGFGIPVLEAMACEVPVLTSNLGALPETAGGNSYLVNPFNEVEIADGIFQLLSDVNLRNMLLAKGKEWVKGFTWEQSAKETINVYKEVVVFKFV